MLAVPREHGSLASGYALVVVSLRYFILGGWAVGIAAESASPAMTRR
jgi:hypothetical protein